MADADTTDLSLLDDEDEPTAAELARARSEAMRRRRSVGELGLLSGDPVLSRFGQTELGEADKMQQQSNRQQDRRDQQAFAQRLLEMRQGGAEQRLQERLGARPPPRVDPNADAKRALLEADAAAAKAREYRLMHPLAKPGKGASGPVDPTAPPALKPKDIEGEFKDMLTGLNAASTGARGQILQTEGGRKLRAAEALEKLVLGDNGQIENLNPQMLTESSMALAKLISNGTPTEGLVQELVPDTSASQWAALKQKITNEPRGAEAQAFLKNMLQTAQREKGLAKKQIREAQIAVLPGYAHLPKYGPAYRKRYESILTGAGLNPSDFDPETGLPAKPTREVAAAGSLGEAPDAGADLSALITPQTPDIPADGGTSADVVMVTPPPSHENPNPEPIPVHRAKVKAALAAGGTLASP